MIISSNDEYDALLYRTHYNKIALIQKVSSGESRSKVLTFIFIFFQKGKGDPYQVPPVTKTGQQKMSFKWRLASSPVMT